MQTHLVTGGTGFVGSALILELLLRAPDDVVVGVVRPSLSASPTIRLRDAVRAGAEAYDVPDDALKDVLQRCIAVAGDVSLPGCGVEVLPDYDYDQLWHSAASLRFEDRFADEIFAVNTAGAARTLDLAARAGVGAFNYFSTAYVSGRLEGAIPEALHGGVTPNNHYEASKLEAEARVAAETRFGVRVLRPSIVIGHSRTLAATNFTGMYGFMRKLYGFAGVMARTQAGLMARTPLRLRGDGGVPLDLVPIDRVVSNAVTIARETAPVPGEPLFFHLNNPTPPRLDDAIGPMFDAVGMARPTWVSDDDELGWIDEKFNRGIDFYRTYLRGQKVFRRDSTEGAVGPEAAGPYLLDADRLNRYYGWYLEQLVAERSALPAPR